MSEIPVKPVNNVKIDSRVFVSGKPTDNTQIQIQKHYDNVLNIVTCSFDW